MRVLLLRAGALGDLLLLRPTMALLRAAGHGVSLIAPARPAAVLAPELDGLFAWEDPDVAALLAGRSSGRLARMLQRSDQAIAFTRSRDVARALAAVGLEARVHDPAPAPGHHAADWLAEGVRELAPGPLPPLLPLRPSPEELRAAAPLLERLPTGFVAIHPGSGSPAKNWPCERFRDLADRLGAGRSFLVARGPADAAASSCFAGDARAVVADDLPLGVLGGLLSQASVVVGNDSGVSHLAAAFGAPTLALFGPTDPAVWRPLGPRVKTLVSRSGTMPGLEPDAVLAAARELAATSGRALPFG